MSCASHLDARFFHCKSVSCMTYLSFSLIVDIFGTQWMISMKMKLMVSTKVVLFCLNDRIQLTITIFIVIYPVSCWLCDTNVPLTYGE